MAWCDLHTHSSFSDGDDAPEVILQMAVARGLSAVALCDHNTVDGLPTFLRAAESLPIEAVPGAEFSVDYEGTELHLLGLYLPSEAFPLLHETMKPVIQEKEDSNRALIASLREVGYELDYEALCRKTRGTVNRSHVADALLKKYDCFPSKKMLFDTLLSPAAGHYREPKRLTVWDMLALLRECGGVSVLAHPFLNLTEAQLAVFLPLAKAKGLIGMECAYSQYSAEQTKASLRLADRFGLLPSGGSDYHGAVAKPGIALGVGTGSLAVPSDWAELLKRACPH